MKKSVKNKKTNVVVKNKFLKNFIIIGVVVLILLFVFAMYSGKKEADREDELASIWDIGILSSIGNFFGFGGSGGEGSGTGPVPGSDYSSFEEDLSSENCKRCELPGRGIVRPDIRADMSDPNGILKACYGDNMLPETGELGAGTTITGVYEISPGQFTTTPVTCPCVEIDCCFAGCKKGKPSIKSSIISGGEIVGIVPFPKDDDGVDNQGCKRCKLPDNCKPILGTTLEDAEVLQCFREGGTLGAKIANCFPGDVAIASINLYTSTIGCNMDENDFRNILNSCKGIIDPIAKVQCTVDKLDLVLVDNPKATCKTYAICMDRLLHIMDIPTVVNVGFVSLCEPGHAWVESIIDGDKDGEEDDRLITNPPFGNYILCTNVPIIFIA